MPASDRAFRALARARPDVLVALIRVARPDLLPEGATLDQEAVDDPHLDLPPAMDADLVARLGDDEVLHIEGQGYRDPDFEERLFQYHLRLVLRYRKRRVRSVALWLREPPQGTARRRVESAGVVIPVEAIALAELPASALLENPLTVCFAAGADLEERSADEVCAEVARRLRAKDASWVETCMALAAAGTRGRKNAMIRAMRQANEPLIIEDLVDIGFDEGVQQGRLEGVQQGRLEGVQQGRLDMARESVLELLAARGLTPTAAERARILAEQSMDELKSWLPRAMSCRSVAELFT
jgi:hypothetical protein